MSDNEFINTYSNNLFSFFNFKKIKRKHISMDILCSSKQLMLNTKHYSNYTNYYNKLTTSYSFKLPKVTDYPIQKNHCIISLKYNHKIKNNKSTKINKTFDKPQKEEIHHNNIIIKPLKVNIEEKKISNKINEQTLFKHIDICNNMNNVIYKYVKYKETYFINKSGDKNREILIGLLKEKRDNEEIYDMKNCFDICNGEFNVKLAYCSLKVVFYNKNNVNISSIKFPFSFMPFFYGLTFADFKVFLSLIIFYNEEKIKFYIDKGKYNQYIDLFIQLKKFYSSNSFFDLSLQSQTLKKLQFELDWIISTSLNTKENFKMRIILPYMSFRINKSMNKSDFYNQKKNNKIRIVATIDAVHTAYFIKNNFLDWDFYLLNSFCLYREFRSIVNQTLSLNNHNYYSKQTINLTEKYNKINIISSIDDSKYELFITKDNNTKYLVVYASKVKVTHIRDNINNSENSSVFPFTLKETIKLNKLSNYFNVNDIIKRSLDKVQSRSSSFDKYKLNFKGKLDFREDFLKFIKPKPYMQTNNDKPNKKEHTNILLVNLFIQWINVNKETKNLFEKKMFVLNNEQHKTILKLDMKKWPCYICDLWDEIEKNSEIKNIDELLEEDGDKKNYESPRRKFPFRSPYQKFSIKKIALLNFNYFNHE